MRDMKRRLRMVSLNGASVRRAKKRYSYKAIQRKPEARGQYKHSRSPAFPSSFTDSGVGSSTNYVSTTFSDGQNRESYYRKVTYWSFFKFRKQSFLSSEGFTIPFVTPREVHSPMFAQHSKNEVKSCIQRKENVTTTKHPPSHRHKGKSGGDCKRGLVSRRRGSLSSAAKHARYGETLRVN